MVSPGVLLGTWAILLVLTAVTVVAGRLDLGSASVAVALAIATVKATFVGLYFMHLKYDNRFNLVVLVSSIFFAVLLVVFVLFDSTQYQHLVRW